jgi:hypothetical protein
LNWSGLDPADRRRTILKLAKGKERAVEDGVKRRAAPLQRTLDRLTPAQREGLIRGLEVLAEEMSHSSGEEASRGVEAQISPHRRPSRATE